MPADRTTRFQSFEDRTDPADVAPRLAALRAEMTGAGLDAFLVPRADRHRGETVPAGDERLAWLTGFTGSAGLAVVTGGKAALFVDGRYTIQAPAQTDTDQVEVIERPPAKESDWLKDNLPEAAVIGYDPWLHTPTEIERFAAALSEGLELRATGNLVDAIWTDRPGPPAGPVEILDDARAGQASADKIAAIAEKLIEAKTGALLVTLPESVCWLFNIRGADIAHTPVTLGFAIVHADAPPELFLDPAKIDEDLRIAFGENVRVRPDSELDAALDALGEAGATVWIAPQSCPVRLADRLTGAGATLQKRPDPVLAAKAPKNPAEIAGMRDAHRLDGIAMARFLKWFAEDAPHDGLTEIDLVERLEADRRCANSLVDISFDTISGAGPNGAVVHYRVTETSNRTIGPGEFIVLDSGGQYREGTTDITRTLSSGGASDDQTLAFTLVLKGMIAVSTARFPKGTTGQQLDSLARQFLWHEGLNYNHGTGHGVGAFLGVHEGPCSISSRPSAPLEPGMILSNEPGYYRENDFGIRTENLIVVVESPVGTEDRPWYEFETLTLAPIDTALIEVERLSPAERDWLNAYHRRVLEEIGPQVEADVRDWLEKATAPI